MADSRSERDPQVRDHEAIVAEMTGGMVAAVGAFSGSERLHPDGRPRAEFRRQLRTISDLRNGLAAFWLLALPFVVTTSVVIISDRISATAWATNNGGLHWATLAAVVAVGVLVMGGVHLRMFVLHHEAAHRLLFSSRRLNDWIGINVFGWASFGAGTHAYRRVHTRHHRDEFGPDEPDFLLYSFYPIKPGSLRRKLLRDFLGVSAWRITRPLATGLFRRNATNAQRLNSLRFYLGQAVVFAIFALVGHPWLYLLLWMLPYATVYQVINRLRAIAEHGGMTRSSDRRETTHHVEQFWLTQRWLTPYQVGHHLAHHVDSGIPYRNLPKLTEALVEDGYITPDNTWRNYRALWGAMTVSVPEEEAAGNAH